MKTEIAFILDRSGSMEPHPPVNPWPNPSKKPGRNNFDIEPLAVAARLRPQCRWIANPNEYAPAFQPFSSPRSRCDIPLQSIQFPC